MIQQLRHHLERLPARLGQPGRVFLHLLGLLELEVAARVVDVRRADAIGNDLDAAGVEHLHHQRRARAGQTRNDDDLRIQVHGRVLHSQKRSRVPLLRRNSAVV